MGHSGALGEEPLAYRLWGIKLGQGVYGLRRAFIVAGAETVALWGALRSRDKPASLFRKDSFQGGWDGQMEKVCINRSDGPSLHGVVRLLGHPAIA